MNTRHKCPVSDKVLIVSMRQVADASQRLG